MKKASLYLLCYLSLSLFSSKEKEEYGIRLITKNETKSIVYNGIYEIADSSFQMEFTLPKASPCAIEIVNLTNKDIYNSFLKHKKINNLEAFQFGHAYSVSVNAYGEVEKSLYLSNDGHQVLMYDGKHFSSFSKADSTEYSYFLTHQINYLRNFEDSKNSKIELKKI